MARSDLQQPEINEPVPDPSPSRHTRRPRRIELPWIWLAIGLLVVLIVAAAIYLASGCMPSQPPIVEPTVTPTATAYQLMPKRVLPTLPPTTEPPAATSGPPASAREIEPGIRVRVIDTGIDGLSFRTGPGTNYARLRTAPDGEIFTVLEGPQEANGYRWWRLQDKDGTTGWGVENWLQPVSE